ncbi:MAG: hypothetical protein IKW71_00895, partial [Elusimicrobiaceae bacterium]|nr:hypothetical protein [Elusimicrobiaceae bacterium]
MQNDSQEFDEKPSSNKDLWLFLIVLDVVFLCIFGFFLYKHFTGQLAGRSNVAALPATQVVEEQLPPIIEEEIVVATQSPVEQKPVGEEVIVQQPVVEPVQPPAVEKTMAPAPQPVQEVQDRPAKQSIIVTNVPNSKYRRVTFRWFGDGNKVSVVSGFTMSKPQALKKVGEYWETTLSIAPG